MDEDLVVEIQELVPDAEVVLQPLRVSRKQCCKASSLAAGVCSPRACRQRLCQVYTVPVH